MKYTISILLLLFFFQVHSQRIYWGNEVVSVSSQVQRTDKYASAIHALGVPNAISPKDLALWAWSPKTPNKGKEHIRVRYPKKIKNIRAVYIAESAAPGAITKITLFDQKGKKHVVYENKRPRPVSRFNEARFFRVSFPPTNYYVTECLVEINTKYVPGANIDAIGISDYYGEIKLGKLINNLEYSRKVPQAENLGKQINSRYSERLPIISPDGNTLYFARKNHPDNLGSEPRDDIWVAQRKSNNQWSHAQNIGSPLNTTNHNFVISVNPTGTNLYLGNKYRSNSEGIAISSPKRGAWGKPVDMKISDHYNNNKFVAYHVSVDEQILLMSVERKDGFGERDLYVSFHKGEGNWTKPKNLGRAINTVGVESSVFLAADGKTMYFSSNGHYNYGGLDIFMSRRLDDSWTNWSPPLNLGPNINTYGNDFNYTIPASGEFAYFSSDENSYGESDLFRILLPEEARPEPVMLMTGRIVDATTNRPIQGKLKYNALEKKKKRTDTTIEPISKQGAEVSDDGIFQVVLPYGENVEIYADIDGYFPISESVELADGNLEGLDSDDPNDPMLNNNTASYTSSKEEVALEREMARLEKELAALKEKKDSPKINSTKYTRPTTRPAKAYQPRTPKPRPSDSAFNYLKNKYYNQLKSNEDVKYQAAEKNNKAVNTMYDKLYGKKEPTTTTRRHHNSKERDQKEVNSLYDKLYGSTPDNTPQPLKEKTPPINTNPIKEKPTEEEVVRNNEPVKEGNEVNSMYDKLYGSKNKENNTTTKPKPQVTTSDNAPEVVSGNAVSEDDIPKDEPTFEELEKQVRSELRDELIAKIKAELRDELIDEVKTELKQESKNKKEKIILDDVSQKFKRDNQQELSSIPLLNSGVNYENTAVELELKALIVEEVKEELKEELTIPIKEELKEELAIKVKEKEKSEAEKQMEEWKKRRNKKNSSKPSSQQPDSKKDPEYVELNQDIKVVPIKVGQVIPMNNIFFDANKSSIKTQSSTELARVLAFLTENKKLIVEVGGHTNGWCSSSFAHELSTGRSKAVRDYFIQNGIPEHRIQYRGYGKQVPVANNDTLSGRKKNQRVELKILEIVD